MERTENPPETTTEQIMNNNSMVGTENNPKKRRKRIKKMHLQLCFRKEKKRDCLKQNEVSWKVKMVTKEVQWPSFYKTNSEEIIVTTEHRNKGVRIKSMERGKWVDLGMMKQGYAMNLGAPVSAMDWSPCGKFIALACYDKSKKLDINRAYCEEHSPIEIWNVLKEQKKWKLQLYQVIVHSHGFPLSLSWYPRCFEKKVGILSVVYSDGKIGMYLIPERRGSFEYKDKVYSVSEFDHDIENSTSNLSLMEVGMNPLDQVFQEGNGDNSLPQNGGENGDNSLPQNGGENGDNSLPQNTGKFSPDGKYFVSGGKDGTLSVWNVHLKNDQKRIIRFSTIGSDVSSAVTGIMFYQKQPTLFMAMNISSIGVYDIISGSIVSSTEPKKIYTTLALENGVPVAFENHSQLTSKVKFQGNMDSKPFRRYGVGPRLIVKSANQKKLGILGTFADGLIAFIHSKSDYGEIMRIHDRKMKDSKILEFNFANQEFQEGTSLEDISNLPVIDYPTYEANRRFNITAVGTHPFSPRMCFFVSDDGIAFFFRLRTEYDRLGMVTDSKSNK